jgi:hypothetical protein
MLLRSILKEADSPVHDGIGQMKAILASKIKNLPEDDATAKALREIEDLLANVNAGGKIGIINRELASIHDASVNKAQKEIARYILGLDMTPAQRDQLFDLWRADKLVKRNVLLGKGLHNFADVIEGYNDSTNPAIKELVNELMRISALGQGKGEFGLSVLSKSINKQEGKGDLKIGNKNIEVKTTDGGAGRFTDQEVRPGKGFEAAANALNDFLADLSFPLPPSGLNLTKACEYYQRMGDPKNKNAQRYKKQFSDHLRKVLTLIFDSKINVDSIVQGIEANEPKKVKQEYAIASFNFYMGQKHDDGVLYINLGTEPITTVYFTDANELTSSKLRLNIETAYLTSTKDVRLPYPQMDIVTTSFGANAKAAEIKKQQADLTKQAKARPVTAPTPTRNTATAKFKKDVDAFATNFAHAKKIYDPKSIAQLSAAAMNWISTGQPVAKMNRELNAMAKTLAQ